MAVLTVQVRDLWYCSPCYMWDPVERDAFGCTRLDVVPCELQRVERLYFVHGRGGRWHA